MGAGVAFVCAGLLLCRLRGIFLCEGGLRGRGSGSRKTPSTRRYFVGHITALGVEGATKLLHLPMECHVRRNRWRVRWMVFCIKLSGRNYREEIDNQWTKF